MQRVVHRASHATRFFSAALVALTTAAPVFADLPVRYSGFNQPTSDGRGSSRLLRDGREVFSNAFNRFLDTGTFNPFTLTGWHYATNDTGGGLGTPVVSGALADLRSSVSAGRANPVLSISGLGTAFGHFLRPILPGEIASGGGAGEYAVEFEVTEPIISHWSGNSATSLSRNGSVLPIGSTWVGNLEPGTYRISGAFLTNVVNTGGVVTTYQITEAIFFLQIGIPSPSAASVLSIAAICACRRRRSH